MKPDLSDHELAEKRLYLRKTLRIVSLAGQLAERIRPDLESAGKDSKELRAIWNRERALVATLLCEFKQHPAIADAIDERYSNTIAAIIRLYSFIGDLTQGLLYSELAAPLDVAAIDFAVFDVKYALLEDGVAVMCKRCGDPCEIEDPSEIGKHPKIEDILKGMSNRPKAQCPKKRSAKNPFAGMTPEELSAQLDAIESRRRPLALCAKCRPYPRIRIVGDQSSSGALNDAHADTRKKYSTPSNFDRDKWAYEEHARGTPVERIISLLADIKTDWESLGDSGVRDAIKRYARFMKIPVPKGKPGRPRSSS